MSFPLYVYGLIILKTGGFLPFGFLIPKTPNLGSVNP